MRSISRSLVLLLLLAAPASAQATEETEVLAVIHRLFEGMRLGDSSMVRSVFHPGVRLISASRRDGKVSIQVEPNADGFARAVGTPHPVVWNERIMNTKVYIDGPVASVWTDYTFHAGEQFSHCGIDHFLLVKEEGQPWRILELSDTRRTTGCPT
ncbi:MAG: nuclear transport factor 2 family protein [Gemmatimonadaceae bacterium]